MSGAYTKGKTIGYDTMFAENFDSRWQPTTWDTCCAKDVDYTFSPTPVKTLQVYEKAPVHTEILPTGGMLYDFGEEITAALHIFAKGKDGAKVRILCGEETENSPVKVRYNMRCRKRRFRIDQRLVNAMYLTALILLACTIFGIIRYFTFL